MMRFALSINKIAGLFVPADHDFGQATERRDDDAIAHLRSPSGGPIYLNALEWRNAGSSQ